MCRSSDETPSPANNPNESWANYRQRMCKDYFTKDVAIVSVQFASDRYIRTSQHVYVTFVDKIAQFGELEFILTL